jgi:hypothetical protein
MDYMDFPRSNAGPFAGLDAVFKVLLARICSSAISGPSWPNSAPDPPAPSIKPLRFAPMNA